MNKKEKNKYILTTLPWILIPIVLLVGSSIALTVNWDTFKTGLNVILIIVNAFLTLILVAIVAVFIINIIKSAKENKVKNTGYKTKAKVKLVKLKSSADYKDKTGIKIINRYSVMIEFVDANKQQKEYIFSKEFNREQVNYLLSLEEIDIITNGKTCYLDDDMSKAKDTPLDYLKDSRITLTYRYGTKHMMNLMYKFSWGIGIVFLLTAAAFIVYAIVDFGKTSLAWILVAIVVGAVGGVEILNALKLKRENETRKLGKKTKAESFEKTQHTMGRRAPHTHTDLDTQTYNVIFKFKTETGKIKKKSALISAEDYAIIDTIKQLPIIVYKENAVLDYDELPKI